MIQTRFILYVELYSFKSNYPQKVPNKLVSVPFGTGKQSIVFLLPDSPNGFFCFVFSIRLH